MPLVVRTAFEAEWPQADRIAVEAFAEYEADYPEWLALYTSPVMRVALPMYERRGFEFVRDLPPRHRVPCVLYKFRL